MADIHQLQWQIAQAQQSVREQGEQVKAMRTVESPTASQLMQRGMTGALQAKEQQRQAEQIKAENIAIVQQEEQRLSGLQQRTEAAIKNKTPIMGSLGKGYAEEVIGYKYDTPFGVVTDYSPLQKAYEREQRYSEKVGYAPEIITTTKTVTVPDWIVQSSPYKDADPLRLFKPEPKVISPQVDNRRSDIKSALILSAINPAAGIPTVFGTTVFKPQLLRAREAVLKAREEVPALSGAYNAILAQKAYSLFYPRQTRIEPKIIGDVTQKTARFAQYGVPIYGQALFAAPSAISFLAGKSEISRYSKENPLEVGALIAAPIIGEGAKQIFKPRYTIKQIGEVKAVSADKIQPYIKKGVQIEKGQVVSVYQTPKVEVYKSSWFEDLYTKSPKLIKTIKPKSYVLYTGKAMPITTSSGEIIPQSGYLFRRVGAKTGKYLEVSGGQSPLDLGALQTEQRYILEQGIKKEAGRAIPQITIREGLKKERVESTIGYLKTEETGKFRLGKSGKIVESTIYFKPKTTTISQQIGITRPIEFREGSTIYRTSLYGKDISIPIPRAAGKISVVTGKSQVMKPISLDDVQTFGIKSPKPSDIKSTVAKTEQALKSATKIEFKPSVKIPRASFKSPKALELAQAQKVGLIQKGAMALSISTKQAQETRQGLKSATLQTQETKQIIKTKQTPKQMQDSFQDISTAQITLQQPEMQLKQLTQQQQKPLQRTQQIQSQEQLIGRIPSWKLVKPSSIIKRKKESLLKGRKSLYSVQIRRKGRFFEVGKLPYARGLKLGVERTKASLAQTFRLIPRGETDIEDISYSVPSRLFTAPKKPVGGISFVERRGTTLSTGSERLEIKQSRRKMKWF